MVPFRISRAASSFVPFYCGADSCLREGVVESLNSSRQTTAFTLGKNNTRGNIPMVEDKVILNHFREAENHSSF